MQLFIFLLFLQNTLGIDKKFETLDGEEQEKFLYDEPDYKVIKQIQRPYSNEFYCQGIKFLDKDTIIESTGLYGESVIHILNSHTFDIIKQHNLTKAHFGEGLDWITTKEGFLEIHQMTYKERTIFVYDKDLNLLREQKMPHKLREGWGLVRRIYTDAWGEQSYKFYATDGSAFISQIDPKNWKIDKQIQVYEIKRGQKVPQVDLNEMEFVLGKLFINVYLTNEIIQVNPDSGLILRRYDFSKLVKDFQDSDYYKENKFNIGHCLNGIAYDEESDRLLITGKKWDKVYEVLLKEVA